VLRDDINNALKDAMKAGDARRVSTLRLVNSALKNADIEARGQGKPPLTDEELLSLLQKRAALQIDLDDLKQRRQLMTLEEYQAEFERMMIDLARVSRDIRRKQKT